jgi:hypothetical protein
VGEVELMSDSLNELVQNWARRPTQNNGLLLRAANTGAGTSQRFDSHEHPDPAVWPRLVVAYELVDLDGEDEGEEEGALEGEGETDGEGALEGEGAEEGEGEPNPFVIIAQEFLENFGAIDTDGNGTIDLGEALAANPDLPLETFAELDANDDGELSERELLEYTGAPLGVLDVGTAPVVGLEFETVQVGNSKVVELTARNTGTAPLTVYASIIELPEVFQVESEPFIIEAESSVTIPVTFSPDDFGEVIGKMQLDTRDGVAPVVVPLIGTGVLIDFAGGCFSADPDNPGSGNFGAFITVIVVLLVIALTVMRLQQPRG